MDRKARLAIVAACAALFCYSSATAQNWPQWRGANRDAKVSGFKAPAVWPKELTQKWKVEIGDGVSTPALVGDRLYVISREGGDEVVRCLDTATGEKVWSDQYPTEAATGFAAGFPGPRASPTVEDGKVITLGVRGILTCYDATSGKILWRKEPAANAWPRFYTSSSPIVVDGLCIAQLGGEQEGGIVAYDLHTGEEKWKWSGDGPAYASPALLTIEGEKAIVAVTAKKLVAINAADGKGLWQIGYTQGRYNAATPIVDGTTMIFAGPTKGITAVTFERKGDALAANDKWKGPDTSLMFNTPVLRDGWLFGVSSLNTLFCANAATGETTWTAAIGDQPSAPPAPTPPATTPPPAAQAGGEAAGSTSTPSGGASSAGSSSTPPPSVAQAGGTPPAVGPPAGGPPGGGRGRGMGMRGGGGPQGYGSVVDLGSVLVGLNPAGKLVFFEPNNKEYKELASYKVSDGATYAYPIVSGNRIFVKDKNAVTLWTTE